MYQTNQHANRWQKWITCTKRHMPSSVDWYPWWTRDQHFHQHSINMSMDTQSTLVWHLGLQSVESWLTFADTPSSVGGYIWVSWHSVNYWPMIPLVHMICQKKYVKCTLPFISRSGDLHVYRRLGDSDCTARIREILGYSRKLGIDVLIGSRIKT